MLDQLKTNSKKPRDYKLLVKLLTRKPPRPELKKKRESLL